MAFHARNGPGELLARYSFVEALFTGRRVLEVGAARATDGATALFLAERGAAAVLSIEPDDADLVAARRAGHHPFVQFHATAPEGLRPGTFDLVFVADGAGLAAQPDRVAALHRLLAPGGRLVTALAAGGAGLPELAGEPPAGEQPAYETFVNALSDHFPLVEVAAQTATIGWVFGLPSEDEPEIAMDGTLAGTPETTAYVAIAGEEPSGLSGFSVVALPVAQLVEEAVARNAAAAKAERYRTEAVEEAAASRGRAEQAEAALLAAEEERGALRARVAELEVAGPALHAEAEAHARAQIANAETQAQAHIAEAETQARAQIAEAEERARAQLAVLDAERAEAQARAQAAEAAREQADRLHTESASSAEGLRAERDGALHARDAAYAECEALRAEREEAIRARDAARAEREAAEATRTAAEAERDQAVEARNRLQDEREELVRDRDHARTRELDAQRSREVALAETVALGETLARTEAAATELSRDRDAALLARDRAASEAGDLRLALDEVRLAAAGLDAQAAEARGEAERLAGRLQELERGAADAPVFRARLEELEALLEAERNASFEVRAARTAP